MKRKRPALTTDEGALMAGEYEYDVFFSYKRLDLSLEWTRQVSKVLKHWLTEELGGHQARVYIDEECIETGEKWPEKLKLALQRSKCMVCVWSPSYFQSGWCVSEWKSFLEREKMARMKSHGLIAPLKFHDGEHFPEEARCVQWVDVSAYAVTMPAFWRSVRAIDLEKKLKSFARSVAKIAKVAPPYRSDWPVVESKGASPPKIGLAKL